VTQLSPTASLVQRNTPGTEPAATAQTTPPPAQPSAAPPSSAAAQTQPQESAAVKAKVAAIYAEAESEHWSEAQTNEAVTKALEQSGSSSSSSGINLVDATA
jgi:hypothetical protein